MVRLRLLGGLYVELDDAQIELASASRKARLLLAILALERRVHGRSELAGRLWPDVREDSARVSLRTALSQLRSALGACAEHVLHGDRDGGVVLGADVETDVEEVERLLATGDAEGALDRCSSELLPGLDDDWVLERRDDLRDRLARGLGDAAAAAEDAGDLQRAVGLTRRMAALDPLAEAPHRELIRRLAAAGDRGAALGVYDRFRERLAQELRIAPSAATRSLVEELRAEAEAGGPAGDEAVTETTLPGPRIPIAPTPTLGRADELEQIRTLLDDPATRLVTIVGPGGVGKTRMALEVGRALADTRTHGGGFVPLAPLAAADHVPFAIAQALGILTAPDVPIDEQLVRYFAARRMLLVLDNCEHLLDAAPLFAELLARAPDLILLATSREPLRLRAERVFELAPLALPASAGGERDGGPQESPAVALFIQVARASDPAFAPTQEQVADIAALCRRLDGLPLAIELAASRIGLLSPADLTRRLERGIDALGPGPRDAPHRHQTLRATLDWSHERLDAAEQAAFARLAVFAGGADVDSAEAVTATPLDVLEALVAKHLVVRARAAAGAWRLGMLETVREFAHAQLSGRPDAEQVTRHHAEHFLALTERVAAGVRRSGSEELASQLDPEIDNVRSALSWALERHEAELALRLAVAFDEYLEMRYPREGERWMEAALALVDAEVPPSVRAAALHRQAIHLVLRSAWGRAEAVARENLILCEQLDDARGRSLALADLTWIRMGQRLAGAGDLGRDAVDSGRRSGDPVALATALSAYLLAAETVEAALEAAEEAAALYERAGNAWQVSHVWGSLAYAALERGDYAVTERALRLARDAAERTGHAKDLRLPLIDGNQGLLALFRGAHAEATAAFCDELRRARQYGFDRFLYEGLGGVAAALASAGGDALTVARLCGAADARTDERHSPAVLDRLDRIFADARARLGTETWQRAYAEGRELDAADAVEMALAAARASAAVAGAAGR